MAEEVPDYKSVVTYDLSQHHVWSDCAYEHVDLRTRLAICACDMCIAGKYYECLLSEETGPMLKYFCSLKDESEQKAEAKMYADAMLQRCISATDA